MKLLLLFLVFCLSLEITKLSSVEVYLSISKKKDTKIHVLPKGCVGDSSVWKCKLVDAVNVVWLFTNETHPSMNIHYGTLNDGFGLSMYGKGVHEIMLNVFSSHNKSIVLPTYTGRDSSSDNFIMIYFYLGSEFK